VALGFVVARRVRPGEAAPPEEFLLVGTGMALGLAGAVVQVLASLGRLPEAAARAGVRCVSLGMLPALVLGLGGLLVPTFARMSDPLTIAGIAKAGDRPRRPAFVLAVAALLVLAVNLDFAGRIPPPPGAVRSRHSPARSSHGSCGGSRDGATGCRGRSGARAGAWRWASPPPRCGRSTASRPGTWRSPAATRS
jgi:hypothetical protein